MVALSMVAYATIEAGVRARVRTLTTVSACNSPQIAVRRYTVFDRTGKDQPNTFATKA